MRAAIDLCSEQGYDVTSVTQVAERAGLTRATFFRHFPDKREVFFAGQEEHSALLAAGIDGAPDDASPLDAVAAGLSTLAASFTPEQREYGPRLRALVTSSSELRERDALKGVGLATAIADALALRGVADPAAQLAAELGVLAVKHGFARWSESDDDTGLSEHMLVVLEELRAATTTLDRPASGGSGGNPVSPERSAGR